MAGGPLPVCRPRAPARLIVAKGRANTESCTLCPFSSRHRPPEAGANARKLSRINLTMAESRCDRASAARDSPRCCPQFESMSRTRCCKTPGTSARNFSFRRLPIKLPKHRLDLFGPHLRLPKIRLFFLVDVGLGHRSRQQVLVERRPVVGRPPRQ